MLTKTAIEQYFLSEKNAGLILMIAGAVAILTAIAFLIFIKTNMYKGMAIPLILLGIAQLAMGYSPYSKSDKQRIDNVYAFDMNPDKLKTTELPRMQKMTNSVKLFLGIELAALVTGVILIVVNKQNADSLPSKALWQGVGIALAIQALIFFSVDLFVFRGAKKYTAGLEQLAKG
ncbi:hypothetical protein DC498_23825 [Terrimonas sp.]|uniref:hypothetical protein n=1 Tax=Terrimonas sp. TaxID=1914338 RepID=UPI000D508C66|nr:hypothetical protein [Terrimonas sp.]PVD49640.1 hypothetical protein DC498_23825 [Terrimonas sp.]